jgi:hypothetical protein
MSNLTKALQERYTGKLGSVVLRIGELLIVAGIVGAISLYGGSAKMSGIVDRVCIQLNSIEGRIGNIENKIDGHFQNYTIHVPHTFHDKKDK